MSIRLLYPDLRVMVAREEFAAQPTMKESNTQQWYRRLLCRHRTDDVILLHPSKGLSAGRNALVEATNTRFIAIMDDDVSFHSGTQIVTLLAALLDDPSAVSC